MILRQNWLVQRANQDPDHPAVYFNQKQVSYAELLDLAKMYAISLKGYNLPQKTAVLVENSLNLVAFIHSCQISGIELVLLNTRQTTIEINWQLDHLNVDLVVYSTKYVEIIKDLNTPCILISSLERSHNDRTIEPLSIDPNRILCYVFTSGTTGKPKAVPLTYRNFYSSAMASEKKIGRQDSDIWLVNMPMFHLGGLAILFRSIISKISILIHSTFDVDLISVDMIKYPITLMSMVPTMLKRLIQREVSPGSLRVVLVGGAATPSDLITRAMKAGFPIAITYGMTETCSQFTTALANEIALNPGTSGRPLDGYFRIFNPDDSGIGEIGVKGPMVTPGYFNTPTPYIEDCLMTGDLGYEKNGNLFVVQRRTDLIISGGENVYPAEIEEELRKLVQVEDACVFGVDDPEWGQVPAACLILSVEISPSELKTWLTDRLASYKLPQHWYHLKEFPRTDSGKIQRRVIMEMFPDELTPLEK